MKKVFIKVICVLLLISSVLLGVGCENNKKESAKEKKKKVYNVTLEQLEEKIDDDGFVFDVTENSDGTFSFVGEGGWTIGKFEGTTDKDKNIINLKIFVDDIESCNKYITSETEMNRIFNIDDVGKLKFGELIAFLVFKNIHNTCALFSNDTCDMDNVFLLLKTSNSIEVKGWEIKTTKTDKTLTCEVQRVK